jgi:hypothetical protein
MAHGRVNEKVTEDSSGAEQMEDRRPKKGSARELPTTSTLILVREGKGGK